jgi:hypothetical protein
MRWLSLFLARQHLTPGTSIRARSRSKRFLFFVSIDVRYFRVPPVRERTLRTERPPLVGEVSANFSG